jgi:hypothetical protein
MCVKVQKLHSNSGFPVAGFMLTGVFFSFDSLLAVHPFVYARNIIDKRATFLTLPIALSPAILKSQSK